MGHCPCDFAIHLRVFEKEAMGKEKNQAFFRLGLYLTRWCPRPDLNRHGLYIRGILSPLRLPISPLGREKDYMVIQAKIKQGTLFVAHSYFFFIEVLRLKPRLLVEVKI